MERLNKLVVIGVGGVLRDSVGNFILGFLDQGPAGLDVLATECAAIPMGLLKAVELGISDSLVASDSQEVVALLKGDGEIWSNLGNIVDDIRRLLVQLCVSDVLFQLCLGNRVAHSLAQFGLREQHPSFWRVGSCFGYHYRMLWYSFSLTEFPPLGVFMARF
ncbi:hypothetical protein CerSpe_111840 [Prunus speciosa]